MEDLDFSKLSKKEIVKYCNENEHYKNKFGEYFCKIIHKDINQFLINNQDISMLYIHVISNNDGDDFKYIIDLDKDNFPDNLCIQLTFNNIID